MIKSHLLECEQIPKTEVIVKDGLMYLLLFLISNLAAHNAHCLTFKKNEQLPLSKSRRIIDNMLNRINNVIRVY